jgi:PAT family beta-lactamase induction signal transducer AmpG
MAFFSASQDILIDAWRIETFPERLQGTALAVYMWSYRGAMLTSTTGVTFIAHYAGWHTALATMAAILMAGMLVTLAAPHVAALSQAIRLPGWRAEVEASVLAPLRDFLSRPGAMTVLAFVLLFKLGKVMADVSAAAFYHEGVGFSTSVIGAANAWGWAGTLGGAAVGGWLVHRRPTLQVLFVTGLCQAASLGLYAALLLTGPNEIALIGKMVLENFASTCADMAFLTYLSSLCSRAFTATQYALLSSLPSVAFHTVGGLAGYAAEALGYPLFYAATIAASLPALAILLQLRRRFALAAA